MPDNDLTIQNLPRAEFGSKKDWPTVSGQIPTKVGIAFDQILARRQMKQTDAVAEAVTEWVEREDEAA